MRKARIDSAEERVRIVAAASRPIDIPSNVPLQDKDKPFFANIIAEFARSEWTPHQLELAAMLARTMADLEEEQRMLRDEGSVCHSEIRGPVANPRKTFIQMHINTIVNVRRTLSLHARAQGGETRDIARRRVEVMAVEADVDAPDRLLASPN